MDQVHDVGGVAATASFGAGGAAAPGKHPYVMHSGPAEPHCVGLPRDGVDGCPSGISSSQNLKGFST